MRASVGHQAGAFNRIQHKVRRELFVGMGLIHKRDSQREGTIVTACGIPCLYMR